MPEVHYPRTLGDTVLHSKLAPAFVVEARVLDVDIDHYTLTVAPQYIKNPQSDIPFASPYQHYENGEGIYFMPEVGSLCWLCYTSQGGKPVVIGWSSAQNDVGSFKSQKQNLNPGDIYMGTRDENFIILRRGGVVQIGGGPLSQRMYIPIQNTIKDFCENYSLHTLGGDLEWTVRRDAETTDGTRPASLRVSAKEKADDLNPIAELEIGSHDDDGTSILSLLIRDSGDDGAAKKIELYLRKTGAVEWTVKGDVSWEVAGEYTVHAEGDATLSSDGNATVSALQQVLLTGKAGVVVDGQVGPVNVKGTQMNITPPVFIGGASGGDAVAKAVPLILWMATHTHRVVSLGADTLPPTQRVPSSITAQSLFVK